MIDDDPLRRALLAEQEAQSDVSAARSALMEAKAKLADRSKRVRDLLADLIADRPLFAGLDRDRDDDRYVDVTEIARQGGAAAVGAHVAALDGKSRAAGEREEDDSPDQLMAEAAKRIAERLDQVEREAEGTAVVAPPQPGGWRNKAQLMDAARRVLGPDADVMDALNLLDVCAKCHGVRRSTGPECPRCGSLDRIFFGTAWEVAGDRENGRPPAARTDDPAPVSTKPANGSRAKVKAPRNPKRLEIPGVTEDRG